MGKRWVTLPDGRRVLIDSDRKDKPRKGRNAVVGIAVGGVVAAGTGVGGGIGAGGFGAAEGALSQGMRTAVSHGVKHAAKGRTSTALRSLKLRPPKPRRTGNNDGKPGRRVRDQLRERAEHAAECAARSYGDVQRFFVESPCRALTRRLLPVVDEHGNRIAVSVVWVRMPRSGDVRELKDLVDEHGTGSLTALGAVGPKIGSGEFTGEAYTSARRGRDRLVVSEAALLDGAPDDETLHTMEAATRVAVRFPRPRR